MSQGASTLIDQLTHILLWPQFDTSNSISTCVYVVCQCIVYGIHDSPSVHTLVAHATFGACYHKIQRDMSTACWAKKKLLYVSKTTNADATQKQHSWHSTYHLQQQPRKTTTTVQLRFMLCSLLRWFMSVSLCTVWSKHWFTQRTLGRQPHVKFSTNRASLCVCAARELRVCRCLCMCVSVCVCGFNCCDYFFYRNVRTGTSSYSNKLNN